MAKNSKKAIERRLERLIRKRDLVARTYICMVYSGGVVSTVESADEFCVRVAQARKQVADADLDVWELHNIGILYGYLNTPLEEYMRRVREQAVAVV